MSAPENTADLILRLCEPAGRIGGVASVPTELLEEAIGALAALQAAPACAFGCGPQPDDGQYVGGPGFALIPACPVHGWVCELLDAREAAVQQMRKALERGAADGESETIRAWCRFTLAAEEEPAPLDPIREATRKARGNLTEDEVRQVWANYIEGRENAAGVTVTDLGDGQVRIEAAAGEPAQEDEA